jgi:hypothetical protein
VPTLTDLTSVFRSKNAGPFLVTIDMMFGEEDGYRRVRSSGVLSPEAVASRYGVNPLDVQVTYFDTVKTIKVTIPRWGASSGAPGDRDVYGAQQHGPLLDLMIP